MKKLPTILLLLLSNTVAVSTSAQGQAQIMTKSPNLCYHYKPSAIMYRDCILRGEKYYCMLPSSGKHDFEIPAAQITVVQPGDRVCLEEDRFCTSCDQIGAVGTPPPNRGE